MGYKEESLRFTYHYAHIPPSRLLFDSEFGFEIRTHTSDAHVSMANKPPIHIITL